MSTSDRVAGITIGSAIAWLLMGIVCLFMWGCPKWRVWQQGLEGQAEFKRAEQNRLILIEEASANLAAQKLNSQAEVERALGMAEAIEIEDGQLTEQYIHYLWVRNIDKMDGDKIYIPTEANLPILEAKNEKVEQ